MNPNENEEAKGAKGYMDYVQGKIDEAKAARAVSAFRVLREEFIENFTDFRNRRKFNPILYKGVFVPAPADESIFRAQLVLPVQPKLSIGYLRAISFFLDYLQPDLSGESQLKATVARPSFGTETRDFLGSVINDEPEGRLSAENTFIRLNPQFGARAGIMSTIYLNSDLGRVATVWQCIRGEVQDATLAQSVDSRYPRRHF